MKWKAFSFFVFLAAPFPVRGEDEMSFPFRVQAVPLGFGDVSFRVEGFEILRYNAGRQGKRPFLFPVIGPAGRMLTRMGHPHDPEGHRHHYSVWWAHQSIDGQNFWTDESNCRQVHDAVLLMEDGRSQARLQCRILWVGEDEKKILKETREITLDYPSSLPPPPAIDMDGACWTLDLLSRFESLDAPVNLGQTPFGFLGIRMAKAIGVHDGGGRIRNALGKVNEKEIFGEPSAWCDYAGFVADGRWEGIVCFDHPNNPGFPAQWHVRNDGWMCPSQFREKALRIELGEALTLRHRLIIHAGDWDEGKIGKAHKEWALEKAN